MRALLSVGMVFGLCLATAFAITPDGVETTTVSSGGASPPPAAARRDPLVQLALLLDTSGSMSGLIEQAKSELWKIVNQFALVEQDGQRPRVQVALYEYGKSSIPAEQGHLRQIVPLTDDLDQVSAELFKLTTNGGSEHCGQVIQAATRGLSWSDSPDDLKTIFIAGNEPFTQGPVDYTVACKEAIARGITINTIFCGDNAEGLSTMWKDGAVLADGSYLSIDHNQRVAHVAAPQDKRIAELGVALNDTYIPYGALGAANKARQAEQDGNASQVGAGSSVQRAVCKSSYLYRNDSWDLVDAVEEGKVDLTKMKKEDLPEKLRKLSPEDLAKHLASRRAERKRLQEEIQKLMAARQKYVAGELAKIDGSKADTLDSAVIKCVREQAQKKRFEIRASETVSVDSGTEKSAEEPGDAPATDTGS